jgi:tetratricopeptide (TPR) repeat protein
MAASWTSVGLENSRKPRFGCVLLVGWDGADWKVASPLIDAGELPQLANLVQHGASGSLASVPPYLSPMLWNSIATGKNADQHGILGFTTTDPATGKLAAISSTQRRCKAVWNILSEYGLTAHVLGWFASHPAENVTGVCVTEAFPRPVGKAAAWPLPPGAVHPPELGERFAALRLRPEEVAPDLLRLFIPRLAEIDLAQDKRPEQLAIRLAELYSVHNAAIAALDRGPCDFLAVYYHFIDWVCHDFMNFHPPRRPEIPAREFEWYREVVRSAYRLQDLLLRDLLTHAGAGSTVVLCSDHGFHSDQRRPRRIPMVSAGIAIWHRTQGIFAAAGPLIARDALVTGATILDITPTILRLFGLPVAADMDGRVLTSAFAEDSPTAPPPPDRPEWPSAIDSYESDGPPFPRSRHVGALNHAEQSALLKQFAALGYVDLTLGAGGETPAMRGDRDNRWNLAITLRYAGKHELALGVLHQLHLERPEDVRYAYHLASCQIHLGLLAEAAATTETILDYSPGTEEIHSLLASLALARGDAQAALAEMETSRSAAAPAAPVGEAVRLVQRGQANLRLGRILEACAQLHAAVEADDEEPGAWLAYAQALLQAGHPGEAETCARQAVALAPTMAAAHFALAQALACQGQIADARAGFLRARELNPRLGTVTSALDRLIGKPFVADVGDLSAELNTPPPDEALRAKGVRRIERHRSAQAQRRSSVLPLGSYQPASGLREAPDSATSPPLILVSGVPRSGTSLMMQMLARGGLPVMTDGRRAADASNPEGYFEWEDIRQLAHDPALLERAAGKAIKVVSPLLGHLPLARRYKVIFMLRPAGEIARSQAKLRARLEPETPPPGAAEMEALLAQHQVNTLAGLQSRSGIEVLTVDYPTLIGDPVRESARVAAFLGSELLPTSLEMPAAVRTELRHEKELAP